MNIAELPSKHAKRKRLGSWERFGAFNCGDALEIGEFPLVFGGPFHAFNDQNFDGHSRGFQLQAKLLDCAAK